jgi:hypothetical protein
MDCRDFRDIAADLARKQVRGGTIDDHAVAHVRACEACAMLLAAEQRLAAGLHVIQLQDESLQAPPDLENALRRELRRVNRPAPAARPGRSGRWRWWAVAAAAAAVVLVVRPASWRQQPSPADRTITLDVPVGVERSGGPALAVVPQPSSATEKQAVSGVAERKSDPAPRRSRPKDAGVQATAEPAATASPEMINPMAAAMDSGTAMAAPNREVVTDFVPLTYGWTSAAPEARLVRVRLPSTALLYFGLPAAAGSALVEADLVLGEDGLAHAVRFVRPVMASTILPDGSSQAPRRY